MAHLAFIAPPFLGHLNPMSALARELVGRGHRATFLHMPDAAQLATKRGFAFRAVGHASHPPGHLAGILRRMASTTGLLGIGGVIRDVAASTDMLCRDLPEALRAIGADLVVCDQTEAAGGLVAGHLGLPLVSVANALPLNREAAAPPPFTGWRYDPSAWGLERNRSGYRVSDWMMRRHAEVIGAYAARWKLGPRRRLDDCLSPLAQISQLVAALDVPRERLPDVFHYCGPLRLGAGVPGFRMPEPDARPLAYASLGTLQGARISLFRRIAKAAARADLRLILAHGGALRPVQVASLPGAPAAYDFVDQDAVLGQAQVAVLNGGLNTVMDALAAGVPIVVLPIAFEQAAIAARLVRAGAGLAVSPRLLTARRLTKAIARVRSEPSFSAAAGTLQTEIAAVGGVRRAADIVEAVLRTGRAVERDAMLRPSAIEAAA